MGWNRDELLGELKRYTEACEGSGLELNSVDFVCHLRQALSPMASRRVSTENCRWAEACSVRPGRQLLTS